jgi:hypothetical protein
MGLRHVLADVEQRTLENLDEFVVEQSCNGSAKDEVDDRVQQALAELLDVFHEAHAGEFSAFCYGLTGPF